MAEDDPIRLRKWSRFDTMVSIELTRASHEDLDGAVVEHAVHAFVLSLDAEQPKPMAPRTACKPAVHELKTWPEEFQAARDGRKTFEFRRHDRDFRVGDVIVSREFEPMRGRFTGEIDRYRIAYVLAGGRFGVPMGYCVLATTPEREATHA